MDNAQLRELVDAPVERLDVEYKDWLDLDDREAQAKLAKHFCALANHGGGFVVFGVRNDMTPAGVRPAHAGPFDQDRMSSIVKRYLTPAFQVEVYDVAASATAIVHPVVWVPSHTAVPVCSLRAIWVQTHAGVPDLALQREQLLEALALGDRRRRRGCAGRGADHGRLGRGEPEAEVLIPPHGGAASPHALSERG